MKTLKKLAEESAYSFKGHWKSAEWIEISLGIYIFVPLIISIVLILFNVSDYFQNLLLFASIVFSIIAIGSSKYGNRNRALERAEKHRNLGNEYLAFYKKIRSIYESKRKIADEDIEELTDEINSIDKESSQLSISIPGRVWSRVVIKREMDIDWIK